jgi:hypothetical protein
MYWKKKGEEGREDIIEVVLRVVKRRKGFVKMSSGLELEDATLFQGDPGQPLTGADLILVSGTPKLVSAWCGATVRLAKRSP